MTSDAVNAGEPTAPESSRNDPEGDSQASEGGSGYGNAETGVGGADAVPDDPDINTRQSTGGGPGSGDGPGAGLSRPENNG